MEVSEMKCKSCGGSSFVQAMDFINLRPVDKKMSFASERIFTVCLDCGEVVSIKVKNPEKLIK
jgi:translation initiation factor 2 beta subunit (eIF-2beta)/eIF-5